MDFNLKEFIGAIGGGLGMGFGVTGLIPVVFPSVIYLTSASEKPSQPLTPTV